MVNTPTDELISVLLNQMYTNSHAGAHGHASAADPNLQRPMEDSRFSELFVYKDTHNRGSGADVPQSHSKASDTTGGSDDSSDPFELLQCHTDRGSDADSYFQYTESGDDSRASAHQSVAGPPSHQLAHNTRCRKTSSGKQKQPRAGHVSKKSQKAPRTPKDTPPHHHYPIQESAILEITLDPSILSQYGEIYYVPSDGGCPVRIKAVNIPTAAYADSASIHCLPMSARSANTATTGATTARDSSTAGSEPSSATRSPSQGKSGYNCHDMDQSDSLEGMMDSQSLFQLPPLSFHE